MEKTETCDKEIIIDLEEHDGVYVAVGESLEDRKPYPPTAVRKPKNAKSSKKVKVVNSNKLNIKNETLNNVEDFLEGVTKTVDVFGKVLSFIRK